MRTLSFEQGVAQVVDMLRARSDTTAKATVFLGAGVSIAAGIPGATGLIQKVRDKYGAKYNLMPKAEQRHYGKVMHTLAPADRRKLIREIIDGARMNWANIALAQLVAKGYFSNVLTVNFDPLLTEACRLVGCSPAVYDFGVAPVSNVAAMATPAIVHLHGQSTGVVLLNTEEETDMHADRIMPLLQHCVPHAPLLVVGYSGEADALLNRMANCCAGEHDVYWLDIFDAPPPHVLRAFENRNYVHYVAKGYADRFLVEVAQKLACFPPEFIGDPLGYLMSEAQRIVEFPRGTEKETQDLLAIWRDDVTKLQQIDRERFSSRRRASNLSMAGDDKAAEEAGRTGPLDAQLAELVDEVRFWRLIKEGNAAQEEGRKSKGLERKDKFERAIAAYRLALEIHPSGQVALNNWGSTLSEMAKVAEDAKSQHQLFTEATDKYAAALAINPAMHEALGNWGIALFEAGRRAVGAVERDLYFSQSSEKYHAASAIKSDNHITLFNWANTLSELAKHASEPEARGRLYAEAFEKYARALVSKPDKDECLSSWGSAISEMAASTQDPAKRSRLFTEAKEKFDAAEAISEGSAIYNLACLSALTDRQTDCRAQLLKAHRLSRLPDLNHIKADPDLSSVHSHSWWPEILALAK
jgi:hypothetical protein